MLQILKPIPLTLLGVVLFLGWAWLSMSCVDYRPGSLFFGLRTAGWFYLGSPFLVVMGIVVVLPFSFIARKTHNVIGWSTLLVVATATIVFALIEATPKSRLSAAINMEIPSNTRIARLRTTDSFNDGTYIFAAFSGSPELARMIAETNDLTATDTSLQMLKHGADDSLPDYGRAFGNDLMICYLDPTDNTIYLCTRSSLPNP